MVYDCEMMVSSGVRATLKEIETFPFLSSGDKEALNYRPSLRSLFQSGMLRLGEDCFWSLYRCSMSVFGNAANILH